MATQFRPARAAAASPSALRCFDCSPSCSVSSSSACARQDRVVDQQRHPPAEASTIFLPKAPPIVRWYLETVCIPGTPLFARLVPLGELAAGLALILGFWTRMAAIVAFLMVLNFHFATSAFWSIDYF